MRSPLLAFLLLASACSFPLSGVTSAIVVWERNHEGAVTVSTVLRAEGECPTLSANARGTLNGVPLALENARDNILEGCSAAAFSAEVDEAFASQTGDGTFVLTDDGAELRIVVANLFDLRGLRKVADTATIAPGDVLTFHWVPEGERQISGYAGLMRDGAPIAYAAGSPAESNVLAVPESLSAGPITLLTQGVAELVVAECPSGVTCSGHASLLGDKVTLEVAP